MRARPGMEGRWRWLLPWTWILGAWPRQRAEADFVLDVCVRGSGLATCSSVLVRGAAACHALPMPSPACSCQD